MVDGLRSLLVSAYCILYFLERNEMHYIIFRVRRKHLLFYKEFSVSSNTRSSLQPEG